MNEQRAFRVLITKAAVLPQAERPTQRGGSGYAGGWTKGGGARAMQLPDALRPSLMRGAAEAFCKKGSRRRRAHKYCDRRDCVVIVVAELALLKDTKT